MLTGCRCLELRALVKLIELFHKLGKISQQLLVLLVLLHEQSSQYRYALVHPSYNITQSLLIKSSFFLKGLLDALNPSNEILNARRHIKLRHSKPQTAQKCTTTLFFNGWSQHKMSYSKSLLGCATNSSLLITSSLEKVSISFCNYHPDHCLGPCNTTFFLFY